MQDTGRLKRPVGPTAQRVLFSSAYPDAWAEVRDTLRLSARIDLAHLTMLRECGILPCDKVKSLTTAIRTLEQEEFEPLRGRPMPRGAYFLYEDYLIERCGVAIAGMLQTGRSRNDLNATILRLQMRKPYLNLTRALLRLLGVLLRRALRHARTVMPLYTHGQPAMPSTYGHYLSGIAHAICRDLEGIIDACKDLDVCPLGASAGAGTSWPIDQERTAILLGFSRPTGHSIDAVASRDTVLRLLAAATICGVTLSRVATDLLVWNTAEFRFFDLPDSVVGSSSSMPQKRNPFMLEHIQGKTALVAGAFQSAVTAMHASYFSNSIAVCTEGVKPLWVALEELTSAVTLTRLVVAAAQPRWKEMLRSAIAGYTTASVAADSIVRCCALDFRSAHRLVGQLISMAEARGDVALSSVAPTQLQQQDNCSTVLDMHPAEAVGMLRFGKGPAPEHMQMSVDKLREFWHAASVKRIAARVRWSNAEQLLESALS